MSYHKYQEPLYLERAANYTLAFKYLHTHYSQTNDVNVKANRKKVIMLCHTWAK